MAAISNRFILRVSISFYTYKIPTGFLYEIK